MTDPIARPGDDDEGIEHATEGVVASWQDATPGKEPAADSEDFARMRRGFGQAGDRETPGEGDDRDTLGEGADQETLGEAAERATAAGGEDPSAG